MRVLIGRSKRVLMTGFSPGAVVIRQRETVINQKRVDLDWT